VENAEGYPVSLGLKGKFWLFVNRHYWSLRYVDAVFYNFIYPRISRVIKTGEVKKTAYNDGWALASPDAEEFQEAAALYRNTTGRYIEKLRDRADKEGINFFVVLTPYRDFYNESFYEFRYSEEYVDYVKTTNFQVDQAENVMKSYLKEKGIEVVSTFGAFEDFKSKHPNRKLFNYYDYHFSEYAHPVIANEIFGFMENSYLPSILNVSEI